MQIYFLEKKVRLVINKFSQHEIVLSWG